MFWYHTLNNSKTPKGFDSKQCGSSPPACHRVAVTLTRAADCTTIWWWMIVENGLPTKLMYPHIHLPQNDTNPLLTCFETNTTTSYNNGLLLTMDYTDINTSYVLLKKQHLPPPPSILIDKTHTDSRLAGKRYRLTTCPTMLYIISGHMLFDAMFGEVRSSY